MLQPSSHHIVAAPTVSPEGTQDRNRMPTISHCNYPWRCTLRRLRLRKHRMLAPDSWGAYQRNDFSEPWLLHLPIHRKALNSLTWGIWFSLINNNLWCFDCLVFVAKKSSVSSARIKQNSQLLGCSLFFIWQEGSGLGKQLILQSSDFW